MKNSGKAIVAEKINTNEFNVERIQCNNIEFIHSTLIHSARTIAMKNLTCNSTLLQSGRGP